MNSVSSAQRPAARAAAVTSATPAASVTMRGRSDTHEAYRSVPGGADGILRRMGVPLMDLRGQWEPLHDKITAAVGEVITSGVFILGPNVKAFEAETAADLGVKHAVGVANGTDALLLALRAHDIGAGDEVICPAYTFYATPESIAAVGATPVFADIEPTTYQPSPSGMHANGHFRGSPDFRPVVVSTMLGTSSDDTTTRPPVTLFRTRSIGGTALGPTFRNQELVAIFCIARPTGPSTSNAM